MGMSSRCRWMSWGAFILRLAQAGLDVHGLEAQILRRAGFKPHEGEPEALPQTSRLDEWAEAQGAPRRTGVERPHEVSV